MKKLLSALIAISITAASFVMPVMADYTAGEYDIVDKDITEEKAYGGTAEKVFETGIDTTNDFYLGFDFRFDSDAGEMRVPKYKSSGIDKEGPIFSIKSSKLVTQISGGTQDLGDCTVGTWYRGEIEGRTGMGSSYTTFRLYDADGTLVQETPNFNMRNISSENRSFTGMQANNVTLKNVKLVQLKPDTISLTADTDTYEINAGTNLPFDYTMTRDGKETTKYAVEYSVYNEEDTAVLENSAISISQTGALLTSATLETDTTVNVHAAVKFGEKTLTGTKQVTVKAVDTKNEKYDTITISGEPTVKAGTQATYTASATKGGEPVTLEDGDVVWKVYDSTNLRENNAFSISNGVLTVPDTALPQDIVVRASSASGLISGTQAVKIDWSANQKETALSYNACETNIDTAEIVESVDGSGAYLTNANFDVSIGNQSSGDVLTEFDIKFPKSGTGVVLLRNDAQKTNTEITSNGTNIREYGGQTFTAVDPDAWYHVEIIYTKTSTGATASANVYPYNTDGTLGERITKAGISTRNASEYGRLRVYSGTCIDNIRIAKPLPNAITVTPSKNIMFAGETATCAVVGLRNGLAVDASGLTWGAYDSENLLITDGSITVSDTGEITVSSMASPQSFKVRATAGTNYGEAAIEVQSSDIIKLTNLGKSEDGKKITRIYAEKKFSYDDDIVFILTIYDAADKLVAVRTFSTFGDKMSLGSNELTVDIDLPDGFDGSTYTIYGMVWTTL